jgi:hypothetical protein
MRRVTILSIWSVLVTALALGVVATARAESPLLKISDVGQVGEQSSPAQPPVTAAPGGSCAVPDTVESSCPPQSWPVGSGERIVYVAGGDQLQLEFVTPVTNVRAAAITTVPEGPDVPSTVAPNMDEMQATSAAQADATGKVWTVRLPIFDARARGGLLLSVVASDGEGNHDYDLIIQSPRVSSFVNPTCGYAFVNTGVIEGDGGCRTAVPPGLPPHSPRVPTKLRILAGVRDTTHGIQVQIILPRGGMLSLRVTHAHHQVGWLSLREKAAGKFTFVVPISQPIPLPAKLRVIARLGLGKARFLGAVAEIRVS